MCYEYYERLQRQEDQRRRELLEQQKRQPETEREPIARERPEWKAPEEPAPIREKVPA